MRKGVPDVKEWKTISPWRFWFFASRVLFSAEYSLKFVAFMCICSWSPLHQPFAACPKKGAKIFLLTPLSLFAQQSEPRSNHNHVAALDPFKKTASPPPKHPLRRPHVFGGKRKRKKTNPSPSLFPSPLVAKTKRRRRGKPCAWCGAGLCVLITYALKTNGGRSKTRLRLSHPSSPSPPPPFLGGVTGPVMEHSPLRSRKRLPSPPPSSLSLFSSFSGDSEIFRSRPQLSPPPPFFPFFSAPEKFS